MTKQNKSHDPILLRVFPPGWRDLTDHELGISLYAWWIGAHAAQRGVSPDRVTKRMADEVRAAILGMDVDDVRYVGLEKALKRIASGDTAGGGSIFRAWMLEGGMHLAALDEAITGWRKQRKIAGKPRPNALQRLIEEIVLKYPEIKVSELLEKLRAESDGDVIERVDDENIEWHDHNQRIKDSPIAGLKDRLSRARKTIKSR